MPRVEHDCSKFVLDSIKKLGCNSGIALDIPSGAGRHSRLLASCGMQVISAAIDLPSLEIARRLSDGPGNERILLVQVDLTAALPFKDGAFDLVLVVHFQLLDAIPAINRLIKPGGRLLLETYGAHGENWRTLPEAGQVAQLLSSDFKLERYKETTVRKQPDRVTLAAIAVKNGFF